MTTFKDTSLAWAIVGTVFITIIGSAMHFAFAWSGYWTPVAIFAAVNESIWEHLKLAFWPGLLWAAIEYLFPSRRRAGFWVIKAIALLVAPVLIVLLFKTYTGLLGRNILAMDIGTFVVAVAAGQFVSAALWSRWQATSSGVRRLGHLCLAVQILAYSTLTYFPPQLGLFMETRSGLYGIPPHPQ